MLYKRDGRIIFRVCQEGANREFHLDAVTEIAVSGPAARRELTVLRDGANVFHTTYALKEVYRCSEDTTPFIEDEDFDFGLLVSNISKNPARKEVLLGRD